MLLRELHSVSPRGECLIRNAVLALGLPFNCGLFSSQGMVIVMSGAALLLTDLRLLCVKCAGSCDII